MKTKYYIYTLHNPYNGDVFYVGCTTNPEKRYQGHVNHSVYDFTKRKAYILSLECDPVMKIIEEVICDKLKSCIVESYWIELFRNAGYPITNQKTPDWIKGEIKRYTPRFKTIQAKEGTLLADVCLTLASAIESVEQLEEMKSEIENKEGAKTSGNLSESEIPKTPGRKGSRLPVIHLNTV